MTVTDADMSARPAGSAVAGVRQDRLEATAIALFLILFAAWRYAVGMQAHDRDIMSGSMLFASACAAAVALVTAQRSSARTASGWRLIACGFATWGIFNGWEIIAAANGRHGPSAVVATSLAFVTMLPSLCGGLLLFPRNPANPAVIKQYRRDLLPVVVALATTGWLLVVGPVYAAANAGFGVRLSAIAHGLGGVGLFATILAVLLIDGRPASPVLRAFALAAGALTVADGLWLRSWAAGQSAEGRASDLLWLVGFALIGVSARLARPRGTNESAAGLTLDKPAWHEQTANLSLVLLLSLAGIQEARGEFTTRGIEITIAASLAVLWFVIARSAFAFHNARRMNAEIGHLSNRLDGLIQEVGRDPLTGLVNRRLIPERIDQALAQVRSEGKPLAVALIDLDNLKRINDSLGHDAGDRVICTVARILSASCRGGDVAARYAGDEFVLVLPGVAEEAAAAVCERIIDDLRQRSKAFAIGGDIKLGLSIGVAATNHACRSAEHMLRIADASMYDAKSAGKNRYHIVDADTLMPLNRDFAAEFPKLSTAYVYRLGDRRGQPDVERVTG